eukprot:gb/GECH01010234.1/.p1 GENE.gb/GECH01010234.1/~~gb/GECH01010234.1/.p1  ORF type:complete len:504 (+),score=114.62 gb/GECH01010234.1/:1-1512(+)
MTQSFTNIILNKWRDYFTFNSISSFISFNLNSFLTKIITTSTSKLSTSSTSELQEDSNTVIGLSAVFLSLSTIFAVAVGIFFFLRRHHPFVRVRCLPISIVSLVGMWFSATCVTLRYLVGRFIYPCPVYAFPLFYVSPILFGTILLRMFRVLVITRVSNFKATLGKERIRQGSGAVSPNVNTTGSSTPSTVQEISAKRIRKWARFGSDRFLSLLLLVMFAFHTLIMIICFPAVPELRETLPTFSGCTSQTIISVIVVAQILAYTVAIVVAGFFLRNAREEFNLTRTAYITFAGWFCIAVAYLTVSVVPSYHDRVEHQYWPAAMFLLIGIAIDLATNFVYPLIKTITWDQRTFQEMSQMGKESLYQEMLQFLNDDEGFKQFLEFSRREFTTENLLFWRCVQGFKSTDDEPLLKFHFIVGNYLSKGAPLALNIPHQSTEWEKEGLAEEWHEQGHLKQAFDSLLKECERNMLDSFIRFKSSLEYRRYIQVLKQQDIVLKEIGLQNT